MELDPDTLELFSGPQEANLYPLKWWSEHHFTQKYASDKQKDYAEVSFVKHKIQRLFNSPGWYVVDPPGNGYCGIYLTKIALDIYKKDSEQFLFCPAKSYFLTLLLKG